MKPVVILLTFFLLVITISCNTIEPQEDNTPAGRRDYEWTVDTIEVPFNYFTKLSGSSSSDVWAVGPGGGLDETLWHFDGTTWYTDGISRMISPLCIKSFARNNVWIAGYEGNIWRYNGYDWKSAYKFTKSGYRVTFQDIWGIDSTNIFAVGCADSADTRKAVILNYNGKTWSEKKIEDYSYSFSRIRKDMSGNGKYYLGGYSYEDGVAFGNSKVALFEFDGQIKKTYEEPSSSATSIYLQEINNCLYLVKGNVIYSIANGKYQELTTINELNFGLQIYGRSKKDIFLRMFDGITHYNGTDVEYLYRFNNSGNISILDAIVFDDAVFFLANDYNHNGSNLIIRGKLKAAN